MIPALENAQNVLHLIFQNGFPTLLTTTTATSHQAQHWLIAAQ